MSETGNGAPEPTCAAFPSVRFAGLRFTPLSVAATAAALAARPQASAFTAFVTPNAEHAYLRRRDTEFAACGDGCWISTNDSRVLGRAARLGGLDLDFAPGAYVVAELFASVIAADDALTIIGGAEALVGDLKAKFSLSNVAHHNPPMGFIHDDRAVAAAVAFVAAHPARFVFVAMGPPQSETFCQRVIADGRSTGVGLCIGSSLAVITGASDPAPAWMEGRGLVWLYRLVKEPRRLWRRYLMRGAIGLGLALVDAAKLRLTLDRPSVRQERARVG